VLIFTVPDDAFFICIKVPAVNPVIGIVIIPPDPTVPVKSMYKFEYDVVGSVIGNDDKLYAIYPLDPEYIHCVPDTVDDKT
jgi:hypothetical protein